MSLTWRIAPEQIGIGFDHLDEFSETLSWVKAVIASSPRASQSKPESVTAGAAMAVGAPQVPRCDRQPSPSRSGCYPGGAGRCFTAEIAATGHLCGCPETAIRPPVG
jgi:hypothetical protein